MLGSTCSQLECDEDVWHMVGDLNAGCNFRCQPMRKMLKNDHKSASIRSSCRFFRRSTEMRKGVRVTSFQR